MSKRDAAIFVMDFLNNGSNFMSPNSQFVQKFVREAFSAFKFSDNRHCRRGARR